MSLKAAFTCNICNKIQNQPVYLPCLCASICQEHVDDFLKSSKKIECCGCHESFTMPPGGLKLNKQLKELIDIGCHLTDEEKKNKLNIEKNIEKITSNLGDFELKYTQLSMNFSNHFTNIYKAINFRREMLIQEVHMISNEQIKNAKICEESFKKRLTETIKCNNVQFKYENEVDSTLKIFRSIEVDSIKLNELNSFHEVILKQVKEDLSKLEAYKNDLDQFKFQVNSNFKLETKSFGYLGKETVEYQLDRLYQNIDEHPERLWKITNIDIADEKSFVKFIHNFRLDNIFSNSLITTEIYTHLKENSLQVYKNTKRIKKIKENMRNILVTHSFPLSMYLSSEDDKKLAKDFTLIPVFFKFNTRIFDEFNMNIGIFIIGKNYKCTKYED